MSSTTGIAINELTNFVKRHDEAAVEALSREFPDFAPELKGGLSLGESEAADQVFAEKKGKVAIRLANEIIDVVTKRIETLREKLATRRRWKIVLIAAGGISGAATLAAIGFSPAEAARIGAIVTSLVAVGNGVYEFLQKETERNIETAITKMSEAKFSLSILSQELDAAVQAHIGHQRIEALANKANRVAEALNSQANALGV